MQELEKKGLPIEFALLPFIESSYDPFSISSSGAVGLWQIMPPLQIYWVYKRIGG